LKIALISDTHGQIFDDVLKSLEGVDEIWHAGDIGNEKILDVLGLIAPVKAIWGNIDLPLIKTRIPEDLIWECEGYKVFMTHIGGYPGRYNKRAKHIILQEKPDIFICGHSHILKVVRDPALKLIHLNPGACGSYGWHKVRTILRFELYQGQIKQLEAIELDPRWPSNNI
jgi:putative phosphoesterase